MTDPYQVLGVPLDASDQDVRVAYHEVAWQVHPDSQPKDTVNAMQMFILAAEAYQVLSDPSKRSEYDIYGEPPDGLLGPYTEASDDERSVEEGSRYLSALEVFGASLEECCEEAPPPKPEQRLGLDASVSASSSAPPVRSPSHAAASTASSATAQRCQECNKVTSDGHYGDTDHAGIYYCNDCWSLWDAGIRSAEDGGDLELSAQLQILVDMGYAPMDAEDALARANGDLDEAVALLLDGPPPPNAQKQFASPAMAPPRERLEDLSTEGME